MLFQKKTFRGEKISSTLLRSLLEEGSVHLTPYYLGTNYHVKVKVLRYKGYGRLEVQTADNYMLPRPGKYHVKVITKEKVVNGEFHRHENLEDEVFVNGLHDHAGKKFSIAFISIKSNSSIASL